jgi:hypothetical protein
MRVVLGYTPTGTVTRNLDLRHSNIPVLYGGKRQIRFLQIVKSFTLSTYSSFSKRLRDLGVGGIGLTIISQF